MLQWVDLHFRVVEKQASRKAQKVDGGVGKGQKTPVSRNQANRCCNQPIKNWFSFCVACATYTIKILTLARLWTPGTRPPMPWSANAVKAMNQQGKVKLVKAGGRSFS